MKVHKEIKRDFEAFSDSMKEYLRLQLDMEKITLLEKLSQFGAYLFKIFVIVYFAVLIAGFLLGAVAVWYGRTFDNYFAGVLIAGACLLVAAVLLIVLRKKIAVASILQNLSQILLNDNEK